MLRPASLKATQDYSFSCQLLCHRTSHLSFAINIFLFSLAIVLALPTSLLHHTPLKSPSLY
jgi:hypothetical protein